jgi:hypothetical protein
MATRDSGTAVQRPACVSLTTDIQYFRPELKES